MLFIKKKRFYLNKRATGDQRMNGGGVENEVESCGDEGNVSPRDDSGFRIDIFTKELATRSGLGKKSVFNDAAGGIFHAASALIIVQVCFRVTGTYCVYFKFAVPQFIRQIDGIHIES